MLVSLSVSLVLWAAACGDDDEEEAPQDAAPVDTRIGKEETARPTAEPDAETGLPASFPEEFPVYGGAHVLRASDYETRYLIEWGTEDSVDDVSLFYNTQLDEGPWTVDEADAVDGTVNIGFSGSLDVSYSGNIAIARLGETETKIILNLTMDG